MTKTIHKGKTDPAISADVSIADPNATVMLTGAQGCEAACPSSRQPTEDCEDTIRALANRKWEAAGCPAGNGVEFWLEAEQEVNVERSTSEFVATSPTSSVEVLSCQVTH